MINSAKLYASAGILAFVCFIGMGCGSDVGVKADQMSANSYVQGTPQDRIKKIESDTTLTPEERQRRIAVVKQRNHLQ